MDDENNFDHESMPSAEIAIRELRTWHGPIALFARYCKSSLAVDHDDGDEIINLETGANRVQADVRYDFVFVDQASFEKYGPTSFKRLLDGFGKDKS